MVKEVELALAKRQLNEAKELIAELQADNMKLREKIVKLEAQRQNEYAAEQRTYQLKSAMEDTILREKDDAARQEREKLYQQLKEMEDMKRENVLLKQNNDRLKIDIENQDQKLLSYHSHDIGRGDQKSSFNEIKRLTDKIQALVGEKNTLSKDLEHVIAENALLRQMSKVPDNFGEDIESFKTEQKENALYYKRKNEYLEKEIKELDEERTKLRAELRRFAGFYAKVDQEGLDEEKKRFLDDVIINLRQGDFKLPLTDKSKELQKQVDKLQTILTSYDTIIEKQRMYQPAGDAQEASMNQQQFQALLEAIKEQKRELEDMKGAIQDQQLSVQPVNSIQRKTALRNTSKAGVPTPLNESGGLRTSKFGALNKDHIDQGEYEAEEQLQAMDSQHRFTINDKNRPPRPIAGIFGDWTEATEGESFKFGSKLQLKPYDEELAGMDMDKAKYYIAVLQLHNMETMELVHRREQDSNVLVEELQHLRDQLRKALLLQDELFARHHYEVKKIDEQSASLKKENQDLKTVNMEFSHKIEMFEKSLSAIQSKSSHITEGRLAELTKNCAIAETNIIKLSRKYGALESEHSELSRSWKIVEADHAERESALVEKMNRLLEWKSDASQKVTILMERLQFSVPKEEHEALKSSYEVLNQKYASLKANENILTQQNLEYKGFERERAEQMDMRRKLEEELSHLEDEYNVLHLRLCSLDATYNRHTQIFKRIATILKTNNMSPLVLFQSMDANRDGYLSSAEFFRSLDSMGVGMNEEEARGFFGFLDIDASGSIDYMEFARKLRRFGVVLRSKEEEVVTRLWNGIVKANLTLETAFKIIDKQGQNSVGFNDMMTAFKDLNVEVDARTASEFFKIVDVSDNGSISAAEFYHIFKKYNKQNENVLSPDSTLDWKMELMVRMDRLAKEKGKSLEEIFTDMDEDKNGRISENEFRRIFLKMGIRIQPEEFKNLFFAIDRNRSGEITYPELLDYINAAKKQSEKLARMKMIDQKLKSASPMNADSMVFDQDSVNDPLVRNQLKIAQLDSREKTLRRQLNEYLLKTNRLEEELANTQTAIKSSEDTNLRLKQEYIKAVENVKRLEIATSSVLTRKQAALLKAESENLRIENTQLRGALNTFRNLHEAAVREAKTLRVSIGRSDDENTHLRKEVRELQSLTDENALIGKLFNQVLAEKWTEAAFNKKYETMHDDLRKSRSDLNDLETKLKKKEEELIDFENSATAKIQSLEKQLFEANLAINPTIPLSKIEELNLALKRISNQKVELEIANKKLRADFSECQIRLDSYMLREQNLKSLEASLKGAYSDELSQKVIELSEKLSSFKLAELKAQREASMLKEREEYYMRVNKGQNSQIAALEEQVVHHMNHLNERENFWRQRHNDQMKLLTRQEPTATQQTSPPKRLPTTPSNEEVRRIVSDGIVSMDNIDSQRGHQPLSKARDISASFIDSEMQILRDKIRFLEDDVKYKDLKIQKLEKEVDSKQVGVNYRTDNIETHVINDLESKTRDIAQAAQHTVMTLQTMIEEKNHIIQEKENKIDRLQAELSDKSKSLSKLELDNDFLQKKQAIEDRARMNVEQYTALKTIDKMSKMDLKDTQKVIADYENKLRLLADQLMEAESVNKELMQNLRTNKAELHVVKGNKSFEANMSEIDKLKKDNQTMTNLYKKKCLEVKNLNEVLMKYTKDLENKQEEISKIKVEEGHKVIAAKNEGGNFEEKIAVLSKKYTAVSEQLKEEKKQLQEFKKSEIKFNERISELNDKISKLTEMNTKLKDENAKLTAKRLTSAAPVPPSPAGNNSSLKRPSSVQKNPQPSSTNLPALQPGTLKPASRAGEADEREVAELKEERRLLIDEISDLRKKMASGPGTQDFIDEDGNLYVKGSMSFKGLDEVVSVLRKYREHAGPKLNYFAAMKRADPRRIGSAPADKIFAELEAVGARFSERNKRIVQDYLPKDAGGLVDYKALYYQVSGGCKDFSVGINREDLIPQVKEKPMRAQKDTSGIHTAVLDKNLDLLKKKLLDKDKEVAELAKQVRNWKQTALGYEAELKEKTNVGRGRLEKGSTVENVIKLNRGENLKQIQDLEEQIRTLKKDMKFEIDKREQVIKEVQEDLSRRTYEMTLAHSEVQNLRSQLNRLTGAKLSPEQLQAEREKEKELLVASLMERLEKSRKAEEELRNKLRSIERENIELKHVKEGIDTKLENLNREIRDLRNKKLQD